MYRTITSDAVPPVIYPAGRGNIIQVRNSTEKLIPVWNAAAIISDENVCAENGQAVFNIRPAEVKDRFWGVVTGNLEPGACGTMVVNGVTPAFIRTGAGRYVTPGVEGLSAANSGRGEILNHPTDTDIPGLILLGGSGNALEYIGYFKLVHKGWTEGDEQYPIFEIINGYRPDDEFCGHTDIPGHEEIPRFEFVLKDLGATITLCVYEGADENGQNKGTYRVAFTIGAWNDGFTRQAIGNAYIDGTVEQAYVSGGTIYFGRDWFL